MRSIDDYWLEDKDESLDMEWTGHTRFSILKPQARIGYNWVNGRETKMQKTTRPDSCWPELWPLMAAGDKEAIAEWVTLGPEREAQRKTRGIWEVKESELTSYNKTLAAAIEYAPPKVPAMEVTSMMLTLQEVRS